MGCWLHMSELIEIERRMAGLSDKHIAVLERIASHKSSKIIARELDISPFTVDQRVRKIMTVLGVQTRLQAAQLYQVVQGHAPASGEMYKELVCKSSHIPKSGKARDEEVRLGELDPASREAVINHPLFSVLLSSRKENRLSVPNRLLFIIAIMIASTLLIAAMISLVEGLSRVF